MRSPAAAQAVRLHDLGDLGDVLDDAGELALPDGDGDVRGEGVAETGRADAAVEGEEGALGLELGDSGLHGVARESEAVGERHVGAARILGERSEEREVDRVVLVHSAQISTVASPPDPAHCTLRRKVLELSAEAAYVRPNRFTRR